MPALRVQIPQVASSSVAGRRSASIDPKVCSVGLCIVDFVSNDGYSNSIFCHHGHPSSTSSAIPVIRYDCVLCDSRLRRRNAGPTSGPARFGVALLLRGHRGANRAVRNVDAVGYAQNQSELFAVTLRRNRSGVCFGAAVRAVLLHPGVKTYLGNKHN